MNALKLFPRFFAPGFLCRLLIGAAASFALAGCGQTGPLYLPQERPAEAASPIEEPAETEKEADEHSR
jgi:predicted small lipoprotein YifL